NDSRPYDLSSAEFGPVHPSDKLGAFELALRYSTLDLNDEQASIKGGEADNITVALNWYVNNNIILRANYIRVNNDANATKKGKFEGDDDLNVYGARIEYLF
ncbi:MAG: porin, partial [Magnetococcus sp. XQGC-1]